MSISIRRLVYSDIKAAIELVRNSFDASLLPLMIYGQSNIGDYISELLPRSGIRDSREFWVAFEDIKGTVLGFADYDVRDESIGHLSYICVDPSLRGQGIATRLIKRFIESHPKLSELELNVFTENYNAQQFYSNLGFIEYGTRMRWSTRAFPPANENAQLVFRDLHTSNACHEKYGFSMCWLEWNSKWLQIGIMGDSVARFQQSDYFLDDELLASLKMCFPALSSALLVSDTELVNSGSFEIVEILESLTMKKTLNFEKVLEGKK